ncbi:MAG: hypothetical protein HXY34_07370 [Candidatus Thorarchaeota archaeon]|nr:hypothetical protein [Candidatus Thorarchaeota archaeon]
MCSAPYPLGADDVVATCPYCGHTFRVDGETIEKHLLIPNQLSVDKARQTIRQWLEESASRLVGRRFIESVQLADPVLEWIPFYRVNAECHVHYVGAKKTGSGDSSRWNRVEETSNMVENEWVLARRHAASFGMAEFVRTLSDARTMPFDIKTVSGGTVLNSEMTDKDARSRARQLKADRDREEITENLDKLLDYDLDMKVLETSYVHVPYWLCQYEHNNGTFRVGVSGVTGSVFLGEIPVTRRYRVKKWFHSILLLLSSAVSLQATPYLTYLILMSDTEDNGEGIILPFILLAVGVVLWAGAYLTLGKALGYEIRVTAEGKELDESTSLRSLLTRVWRRIP